MSGENSKRRILITGGSGFIGTNLVEHFARAGWEVVNLDILAPRNKDHAAFWKALDIRERKKLIEEVSAFQPSFIIHCAARTNLDEKTNLDGYSANFDGVCHLIEAIRAVGTVERTIFFSSQLVCRLGYQPKDEYDYCPSTLYGRSKALGETIVRTANKFNTIWTILRPTSLWGPWFDIPYKNFFTTISRNLYIHPGGITTLKQWGFVGNAVYQIEKILQAPEEAIHRKTFYLADYLLSNLHSFADQVQACFGSRRIPSLPANLLRLTGIAGDMMKKTGWKNPPLTSFRFSNIVTSEVHNLAPLEEITGPLPYTMEAGIEITVRWMRGGNQ